MNDPYNPPPLEGSQRVIANMSLALANLIVVLDMSIANVSIPHIAGSLGISPSQGTWIVTSYAVADAVTVPLTGWLSQRFGGVRTFTACVFGFGIFSMLCGLSGSLGMLVACRIGQGMCGGPIMPMSQVLLQRINPPEKRGQAMGIWAMTTLVGPALGPILGGVISDNWSWHWIFFINIPVVMLSIFGGVTVLRAVETPKLRIPIDKVGLALMLIWIGALQIMLDIGREHDWFADPMVVLLAIVAMVGFALFVIWELTEEHPIVDLRIFRNRGYAIGVLALALGFGCYFAGLVVLPQWLQVSLGYSATRAGFATSFGAMAAMLVARFPPKLLAKGIDPRLILCGSLLWLGATTMLRTDWTTNMDYWSLIMPQIVMGFGMPFFFITVTVMALGSVQPHETASAAGMQSFVRTIGIAVSTSLTMTYWGNFSRVAGSDLAGQIQPDSTVNSLLAQGFSLEQARGVIAQLVERESVTLATDHMFFITAILLCIVAGLVWLAPRQRGPVAVEVGH